MKPRQMRVLTPTFIFAAPDSGPALGFPCFCRAWDPHSPLRSLVRLQPGCTGFFSANLCPSYGQHGWQTQPGALHPAAALCRLLGPRLPVPAKYQLRRRGSAGASHRWSHSDSSRHLTAVAKQMFPPDHQRNPRMCQSTMEQVLLCSASSSHRTALLCSRGLLPWPTLGRATARWTLGAGRQCRGMKESVPASAARRLSIKGEKKNPLLVCVPADSRRVLLLCLSCYLCLSFDCLSWGRWKLSQAPRRARPPPRLSPGRLETQEHRPAAAAFPGRAGMCSQGSCPALPPLFCIHENSISQGAGRPEASSEVGGAVPPAIRLPTRFWAADSCPGAVPNFRGTREMAALSMGASPCWDPLQADPPTQPKRAVAGLGPLVTPPAMPEPTESPSLPPTQSRVFPPPLKAGPSDAQGSHATRTPVTRGTAGTPLFCLHTPPTARGAHGPVSQMLRRRPLVHLLPSPGRNTKAEEAF